MAQVLRHRHPVSDSFAPRHQRAILSSRSRSGQTSELSTTSIPFIDPHQVLVKTSHVALNAYDGQSYAGDDLKVLGRDGVGLVAAIGSSVTRLKVGQRVRTLRSFVLADEQIWFCSNSSLTGSGAFQDYSVHNSSEVGILPDDLSDEGGAALGSGLLTAGVALFGTLGLQLHSTIARKDTLSEVDGPWFLVWGGAGITGVYMIQLAKLCGYRVICAASPLNHAYVQSLGAEVVLDRWKDEEELVHAIRSATADSVSLASGEGDRADLLGRHCCRQCRVQNCRTLFENSSRLEDLEQWQPLAAVRQLPETETSPYRRESRGTRD